MKKILGIMEIIFRCLLVMIIIINLISIFTVKFQKNEYPSILGYTYFDVISGSMDPTISVGDEVIVKITDDVKENDIISFQEDGAVVTHRLIQRSGDYLLTKGDNNKSNDIPITIDKVIGKVIMIIPWMGKIKYILTNYIFIGSLIGAYIIYQLIMRK